MAISLRELFLSPAAHFGVIRGLACLEVFIGDMGDNVRVRLLIHSLGVLEIEEAVNKEIVLEVGDYVGGAIIKEEELNGVLVRYPQGQEEKFSFVCERIKELIAPADKFTKKEFSTLNQVLPFFTIKGRSLAYGFSLAVDTICDVMRREVRVLWKLHKDSKDVVLAVLAHISGGDYDEVKGLLKEFDELRKLNDYYKVKNK